MKRRPLIAGNWKMNKTPQETSDFIERFLASSLDYSKESSSWNQISS